MEIKRIIPNREVSEADHYWYLAELAVIFNHEIVEDDHGTWRWKENGLINNLYKCAPVFTPPISESPRAVNTKSLRASVDLNGLWMDLLHNLFSMEEMMKFYMGMGYSLSGFIEIFGQREAYEFDLEGATHPDPEEDPDERSDYLQTIIDYMLEKHKGQVLKL